MKFHYLVYDIESCIDKNLLNKVLYPGQNLNDQEAYERHLTELAEKDRTFINPSFHVPISIAAVGLDENFEILKIGLLGKNEKTSRAIVEHFWEIYNEHTPVLIDFNGKGYDLRLLELWAFRLGLTITHKHFDKFGPRYRFNMENQIDLSDFLSNFGAVRWQGGLNLFSKVLGKPGKTDTKGDMVQELFEKGERFRIDDYCLGDTMDTYFVFLRSMVMRGHIDLQRERELVDTAKTKMEEKQTQEGYFNSYLENFGYWDPVQIF